MEQMTGPIWTPTETWYLKKQKTENVILSLEFSGHIPPSSLFFSPLSKDFFASGYFYPKDLAPRIYVWNYLVGHFYF